MDISVQMLRFLFFYSLFFFFLPLHTLLAHVNVLYL